MIDRSVGTCNVLGLRGKYCPCTSASRVGGTMEPGLRAVVFVVLIDLSLLLSRGADFGCRRKCVRHSENSCSLMNRIVMSTSFVCFACVWLAILPYKPVLGQPYSYNYERPDKFDLPDEEMPPDVRAEFDGEPASEEANLAFALACAYGDEDRVEHALHGGKELKIDPGTGFAVEVAHSMKVVRYDREWKFTHKNDRGETALHRAVVGKHEHIVRLLVDAGWGANEPDKHGHTPLDIAHQKHYESLAHFLEDMGGLAEHHRANLDKFRKHRHHIASVARDDHDKYHHQHEHAMHGAHSSSHWRKNPEYHGLTSPEDEEDEL